MHRHCLSREPSIKLDKKSCFLEILEERRACSTVWWRFGTPHLDFPRLSRSFLIQDKMYGPYLPFPKPEKLMGELYSWTSWTEVAPNIFSISTLPNETPDLTGDFGFRHQLGPVTFWGDWLSALNGAAEVEISRREDDLKLLRETLEKVYPMVLCN